MREASTTMTAVPGEFTPLEPWKEPIAILDELRATYHYGTSATSNAVLHQLEANTSF